MFPGAGLGVTLPISLSLAGSSAIINHPSRVNPSSALAGHPTDPLPVDALIKPPPRSEPYTSLIANSKLSGLASQVLNALIPHRI